MFNNSNITSLPSNLTHITSLSIQYTNITSIPLSYINLIYLDANDAIKLTEIPKFSINLKVLKCNYTNIKSIPDTLVNLEYIECMRCNNLCKLPNVLNKLKYINCNDSYNLTVLPCSSVYEFINCSNTKITVIPKSPIKELICNCAIDTIPTLEKLIISNVSMSLCNLYKLKWLTCINCIIELFNVPYLTVLHLSNTKINNMIELNNVKRLSLSYLNNINMKITSLKYLELYNTSFIMNNYNKVISIKAFHSDLVLNGLDNLKYLKLNKCNIKIVKLLKNIKLIKTDLYTFQSLPLEYYKYTIIN